MELKEFLPWATTTGAALLTYWLIENVKGLVELPPLAKRIAAYVLSAGFGILAYLAEVGMLYVPQPEGWRAWVETLFLVGTGAFGLATMIHGAKKLPNE